jgi:hypothetical protein
MNARADNLRVERAAVAATELSLSRCAGLYAALPVVDHGTDLLVYQVEPFRVAKVQVIPEGAGPVNPCCCCSDLSFGSSPVFVGAPG